MTNINVLRIGSVVTWVIVYKSKSIVSAPIQIIDQNTSIFAASRKLGTCHIYLSWRHDKLEEKQIKTVLIVSTSRQIHI